MKNQFRYNTFFLFFINSEINSAYKKARIPLDLQALKFVLTIGAIISTFFLFFDIYRYREAETSIIFRGTFALSLLAFLLFTKFLNRQNYKAIQFYIAFIVFYAFVVGFSQALFMEKSPVFLSNFLSSIFFFSSTIFGLRFRYIILLNTISFIGYLCYVNLQGFPSTNIAITQIPQLSTFYIIGIISAYLLELHKMKLFSNEHQLKEQIQKVEELNHVKDRLFSTISHDIRGPIMNLKGVTTLYRKRHITNEELISLVSSLDVEVAKTANLIDNLLAWSKSQLEGIEVSKSVYSIAEQVATTLDVFDSLIKDKSLNVVIEIDPQESIFADKEMMVIVIRNILSNAVKFTPIGGSISVQGQKIPLKKCFQLIIKDSGAGIETSKIDQLYKVSHQQLIGSHTASGAGIGLTLVKEYLDLNGGRIFCESKVGVGTTFTIEIPQPTID